MSTRHLAEFLSSVKARLTRQSVESVMGGAAANARLTRESIEAVTAGAPANARLTRQSVEVVRVTVPIGGSATVTGAGVVTTTGTKAASGSASVTGAGVVTATGVAATGRSGSAIVTGAGVVTASGVTARSAGATDGGAGVVTTSGTATGAVVVVPPTAAVATYEVRIVDMYGTIFATLANAIPRAVRWRLNQPTTAEFEMSTTDAQAPEVKVLEREAQIWRDGKLLIWGPITRAEADRRSLRVQFADPLWYLRHRYFGPIQVNYLANPSFELGLLNWTAVGTTASTVSTGIFVLGQQSARLAQANADTDTYLRQSMTLSGHPDQGVAYVLAFWFYIDPTSWVGPAFEERGLFMQRTRAGVLQEAKWEPITNSDPRGQWVRRELFVIVPTGQTETVEVRLYSPGCVIYWDAGSVTVYESVGTTIVPEDAAVPFDRIVEYAQDATKGKSPLNLATAGPQTGQHIERHWQFADHGNIAEAMGEFPRIGVCDYSVVYDPAGTTRTLQRHVPRKGEYRPGVLLELSAGGSLADFSYRIDGEQTATAPRVLGQGDGPDREIGKATDASGLGGLILESVSSAPTDAPPAALDQLAAVELGRTRLPVRVPTLTTHERSGALIGVLATGDSARVVLDHGWVQEDSIRRIVGITLEPKTETLDLEVNIA